MGRKKKFLKALQSRWMMGQSSSLLFSDEFTGASAVTGAADVRGYRTFVDVEGLMTQSAGRLNVPAQASAVWGDETYLAQPNSGQQYFTRPAGHALVAIVNFSHTTQSAQIPVGWWTAATLNSSTRGLYTNGNVTVLDNGSQVSDGQAYSISTDVFGVAVWDEFWFSVYAKISGIWHLKWRTSAVGVTQAYCGMSNLTSVGTLKYFRVYTIDETLFAPALNISNPSVGNLANMPDGDFLMYLDNITRPSVGNLALYYRKKDASNFWRSILSAAGALNLDEFVAGSGVNRNSGAGVVSTDDIITIARGSTIQAWRNAAALGSAYTSAYNFLRETGLELNSLGTGGAIGTLYAWKARLLNESGLGAELVVNGNCESWASATNLNDWTETLAGLSTVNRESTDPHSGTYSVRFDVVASANVQIDQTFLSPVAVGEYYRISLWHKTTDVTKRFQIVFAGVASVVTSALTWSETVIYVPVISPANNILIQRFDAGDAYSLYFDDISVTKQNFAADSLATVLDTLIA